MTGVEHDGESFRRAQSIVVHGRLVTLLETLGRRSANALRASQARAILQHLAREFLAQPASYRAQCALLLISIAVAGHVVATMMLPVSSSPSVALSAGTLVLVACAALAASRCGS